MAKLENVKVIDMIDGKVARIQYNGKVYERVIDEASAGDLVLVENEGVAEAIEGVEAGAFYELYEEDEYGDLVFADDDDDERVYSSWSDELVLFRAIETADKDIEKRVAELERRLAAIEQGDKDKRITVGDYAKVVAKESGHGANIGDIVIIKQDDHDDQPYNCESLNGINVGWFFESELVKATDEEINEAKRKIAENSKWAKIGREPGEFKVGDIVRVKNGDIGGLSGYNGLITVIDEIDNGIIPYHLVKPGFVINDLETWYDSVSIELVAPVERRVDLD